MCTGLSKRIESVMYLKHKVLTQAAQENDIAKFKILRRV